MTTGAEGDDYQLRLGTVGNAIGSIGSSVEEVLDTWAATIALDAPDEAKLACLIQGLRQLQRLATVNLSILEGVQADFRRANIAQQN